MAEGKIDAFMIIKAKGFDPIEGESLDAKFGGAAKGGFEIFSFDWGVENRNERDPDPSGQAPAGGPAPARRPTSHRSLDVRNFKIHKAIDNASPSLFLACCEYPDLDNAKIVFRKAGAKTPVDFAAFYFTHVRVESVDWEIKDVEPEEVVKFSFRTGQIMYRVQRSTGTRSPFKYAGWNLDDTGGKVGSWGSRQVPPMPSD